MFLNGQPYSLWLQEGAPTEEWKESERHAASVSNRLRDRECSFRTNATCQRLPFGEPAEELPAPMRIITRRHWPGFSAESGRHRSLDERTGQEAHFLPYAAPSFIGFRQGAYLQLSIAH